LQAELQRQSVKLQILAVVDQAAVEAQATAVAVTNQIASELTSLPCGEVFL